MGIFKRPLPQHFQSFPDNTSLQPLLGSDSRETRPEKAGHCPSFSKDGNKTTDPVSATFPAPLRTKASDQTKPNKTPGIHQPGTGPLHCSSQTVLRSRHSLLREPERALKHGPGSEPAHGHGYSGQAEKEPWRARGRCQPGMQGWRGQRKLEWNASSTHSSVRSSAGPSGLCLASNPRALPHSIHCAAYSGEPHAFCSCLFSSPLTSSFKGYQKWSSKAWGQRVHHGGQAKR